MKRVMHCCAAICTVLTAVFVWLDIQHAAPWIHTLAITFGTVCYHFVMRLLVGALWTPLEHRVHPEAAWYRAQPFEAALYKMLRVKSWKHCVPTYNPSAFDIQTHTLEDLLCATCHSERVHETIMVLSFVPLVGTVWFDELWAFLLTSCLAAAIDAVFVVVQRFNRPRLFTLLRRQQRKRPPTP